MSSDGFKKLRSNFRQIFRRPPRSETSGDLRSERLNRIRSITRNFFFHFQSSHTHPHSLKPTATWGLGVVAVMLLLILVVTGCLLMVV